MHQFQVAETVARFPTTSAQQRFWFQEQVRPGDVELNIAVRWEIRGTFRESDVERAFQQIVDRHEILRTRFVDDGGVPVQEVVSRCEFRLGSVDLRAVPSEQHEARVDAISRELGARSFDLSTPGLFRVTMVSLAADRAALLIVAHHIVFDGFSIGVLGHELGTIMQALNERKAVPLDDLALQYGDYALWEEEVAGSDAMEEDGRYWEERLKDADYFELTPDFPRPAEHTARGLTITLPFAADFDARMTEFCKQQGVSVFTFGAAAMGATLQRWTGQTDILFSVPTAVRADSEIEKLIGVFVNTMVMRMAVEPGTTLRDHIIGLKPVVQEALEHQAYPFDALVRRLKRPRHTSRPHLVSLNLNMQRVFLQERSYGDFRMISVPSHMPGIYFDMNVQIVGRDAGWKIMLDYNENMFRKETAERFARLLQITMEAALTKPTLAIADIAFDQATVKPEPAPATPPQLHLQTGTSGNAGGGQDPASVEAALRDIWSEVLHIPKEACDGDFFDIGGHSLQALRMIAVVESRFGVRLPLAAFLADSTLAGSVRALAEHMPISVEPVGAQQPETAIWSTMDLRDGPADSPVIVTVNQPFLYHSISRKLTASCAVVNLSVQDDAAFTAMQNLSFDEIAGQAARLLGARFAGRPILALGHCVDALVALRICQDLVVAGGRVVGIGMIDAWAPGTFQQADQTKRRRRTYYIKQKLSGNIGWKDLLLKNRSATNVLRKLGMAEDRTSMEVLSTNVNHHLFRLSRDYDFAPYPGDVMLFRTDAQTVQADEMMFGWNGILADDTPIHAIRGWHEDALLHEGIERISRILDSKMARCVAEGTSAGLSPVGVVRG
jgi:thioesterase domain-containing protein/acyl carrier protein